MSKSKSISQNYNDTRDCKINSVPSRILKSTCDVLRTNNRQYTVLSGSINKLLYTCQKIDNFVISTDYLERLSKQLKLLEQMYGINYKLSFCTLSQMKEKMNFPQLLESSNIKDNEFLVWAVTWNKNLKSEEEELRENGLL